MDKLKQYQATINIALLGSGFRGVIESARSDLLEAGYNIQIIDDSTRQAALEAGRRGSNPRILIIDEVMNCSPEVDEFLKSPSVEIACYMRNYLDDQAQYLPVKNDHHSNEPWRRKQWKNR